MESRNTDSLSPVLVFVISVWFFPTLMYFAVLLSYLLGIVHEEILTRVFWHSLFLQKMLSFPLGSLVVLFFFLSAEGFIIWKMKLFFRWVILCGLLLGAYVSWRCLFM